MPLTPFLRRSLQHERRLLAVFDTFRSILMQAILQNVHWGAGLVALAGIVLAVSNGDMGGTMACASALLAAVGIHFKLPVVK